MRKFGILLGINDYKDSPLDYCVNDVNKIYEALIKNCEFNKTDIRKITSDIRVTNRNIYSLLENAIDSIKYNFNELEDSIFFFFSGHGIFRDEPILLLHEKELKITELYSIVENKLNFK